jgi:protein O-mannosyl-transferase
MVSAPIMVLLYDRTFVAGSFRTAWQQRRGLYLGLAGTWILLAYLVAGTGADRGGAAGFGHGITWWTYALTQCQAVVLYLRLVFWPHPLIVDYGTDVVQQATAVLPQALILVALVVGTCIGLRQQPVLGFLGAWFFMILAPSSSVVPLVTQTIAEHRIYLPLAAVLALVVASAFLLGKHLLSARQRFSRVLGYTVGGTAVFLLSCLTVQRNRDYGSAVAIWSDTVQERPKNSRARTNLGNALLSLGRVPEATAQYNQALRLKPDYAEAHYNLGKVMAEQGKMSEAIEQYEQVLRIWPDKAEAHNNLGKALFNLGRVSEAIGHYEQALRVNPEFAEAHYNLGLALNGQGKPAEAMAEFAVALRIKPDYAEAHNNLGVVLADHGKFVEAAAEYAAALRINPDYADAHYNLANALAGQGKLAEAIAEYTAALRINPNNTEARGNLAVVLDAQGKTQEAIAQYREALRFRPDWPAALSRLAWLLAANPNASLRNGAEAVQTAQRLCEITGYKQAEALDVLAAAHAETDRFSDAIQVAQKAVELANAAGQGGLAERIQERLKLYQAGHPYRDASAPAP